MPLFRNFIVVLWVLSSFEGAISHGVQPLSRISIENAVIALEDSAYIRCSPSVLGANVCLGYIIRSF